MRCGKIIELVILKNNFVMFILYVYCFVRIFGLVFLFVFFGGVVVKVDIVFDI